MAYDTSNVLVGKRGFQVLREIAIKNHEGGSYGSEVAENTEMKQQQASEIISMLHELNIVQEGKRTRAQYYELDGQGIVNQFRELLKNQVEENLSEESLQELQEYEAEFDIGKDFEKIYLLYLNSYFQNVEGSTIQRALLEDFFLAVERLNWKEEYDGDMPEWLQYLRMISRLRGNLFENPEIFLRKAMEDFYTENNSFEVNRTE